LTGKFNKYPQVLGVCCFIVGENWKRWPDEKLFLTNPIG